MRPLNQVMCEDGKIHDKSPGLSVAFALPGILASITHDVVEDLTLHKAIGASYWPLEALR